jgi:hypothetical protein
MVIDTGPHVSEARRRMHYENAEIAIRRAYE